MQCQGSCLQRAIAGAPGVLQLLQDFLVKGNVMRVSATSVYLITIVGFRDQEFRRLVDRCSDLPVELIRGGCLYDGSNASQRTERAARRSDLVVWRLELSRTFSHGFMARYNVVRVHGVSGAQREIRDFVARGLRRSA
jgi:hypothetical protein